MGEYADERIEHYSRPDFFRNGRGRRGSGPSRSFLRVAGPTLPEFWTMRDGTRIRIEEMGATHRSNAMRMLRRKYGLERVLASGIGQKMMEVGVYGYWRTG